MGIAYGIKKDRGRTARNESSSLANPLDLTQFAGNHGCVMRNRVQSQVGSLISSLRSGDVHVLLARYSDLGLAALVVLIVSMMIVPLPSFFLDLLISLNIAVAVILLLVAIYVSDALKIATFPSLLLLTTLFRLAIEVSATRLILLKANAGQVIHAFGSFVVAGNLVVGVVVFVILTTIQFIVIAKGSGRVAEVGARFTLDAMPGKQLSIDAELRAGLVDHNEARRRRVLLARESQFFGSMDGAMKFVKGDALAGIVVLLTNIVGGLVIGVLTKGMDVFAALRTYTLLTIGEGLVAQIPALVISTAAGILVTRVSSEEEEGHLGSDIGRQILAQPKALAVSAALLVVLALVPGLPAVPFLILGALLGLLAYRLTRRRHPAQAAFPWTSDPTTAGQLERPSAMPSLLLVPIEIELSPALSQTMLPRQEPSRLTSELLPVLRETFFSETGIALPMVNVRGDMTGLAENSYLIRLQEIPMANGIAKAAMAMATPERLRALGIAGEAAAHPDGTPAAWISARDEAAARRHGLKVRSPEELVADHLLCVLRRHGSMFVGIEETQVMLQGLERTHPSLVREVIPKLVSPALLADVLQRLAREGLSLRNLVDILGAIAKREGREGNAASLAEEVRRALQRQITFKYANPDGTAGVFLLDAMIEETMREAIRKTDSSSHLALEPDLSHDIVQAVRAAVAGVPLPVVLTSGDIRRHLRALLECEQPQVAVLAHEELTPETKLQTLGCISV
jgi:type III secretion protein V